MCLIKKTSQKFRELVIILYLSCIHVIHIQKNAHFLSNTIHPNNSINPKNCKSPLATQNLIRQEYSLPRWRWWYVPNEHNLTLVPWTDCDYKLKLSSNLRCCHWPWRQITLSYSESELWHRIFVRPCYTSNFCQACQDACNATRLPASHPNYLAALCQWFPHLALCVD